jgi:hypothetical protein
VKAICDVLFAARINALDGIRREKVSVHDVESQASTDYLDRATVTNEIALLSPYEVSVRCFSAEIAGLLSGFAASPNGLIVRAINVDPAVLVNDFSTAGVPAYAQPVYQAPAYVRRAPTEGGEYVPQAMAPAPTYAAAAPAGKGGLPTILDEKQLKVTLLIEVVKLTPTKK